MPDQWWHAFESQALNAHIDTALQDNFSLAAAWDRLNAARAVARRERADLFPDLNLAGSASREIDDDGQDTDQFSLGPTASYEVDLWGRVRAQSKAEDIRALATEESYRTAALTLSADIALTWLRLIEAHTQHDLLNRQIETNKKALEVLRARFGAGQVRSEDILRQKLLIEAVVADKITIEASIEVLEHQLAVLRGEAPQGQVYAMDQTLPDVPPLPDVGVPSTLIQRRPDVREAYYNIKAADQDLAAAIRDRYPRLTVSASYISEAATAGNLFTNWITSLVASVMAPVFDGGERRAEVERARAERTALVNMYGQSVLQAFQEVEDALAREKKQRERIDNLTARLALARDTYEQIKLGYFNGVNEFISMLSAQTELQSLERDLLRAERTLIEYRIGLYRALAGGFETPRETEKQQG